jgi:catechol 2,3-dioxygenase-like lactoylglutathione lyase family enzyme
MTHGPAIRARYAHTNLVATAWRQLAKFHEEVFGCVPMQPTRNYSGSGIEQLTGLLGASLQGIHLRLPGHGEHGPTLEIFTYTPSLPTPEPTANRCGYGHVAFSGEDLGDACRAVLAAGGGTVGHQVRFALPDGSAVTAAYVTDPEGNIIELQSWEFTPSEAGE